MQVNYQSHYLNPNTAGYNILETTFGGLTYCFKSNDPLFPKQLNVLVTVQCNQNGRRVVFYPEPVAMSTTFCER